MVVLPTVTSIMREVFSQAPIGEREGAIALGATRWGMIRTVVIPFGRSGIVGGIMLGLGRALGETIVVYALISPMFDFTTQPLQSGTNTIASHIASRYSESERRRPGRAARRRAGAVPVHPRHQHRSPASW